MWLQDTKRLLLVEDDNFPARPAKGNAFYTEMAMICQVYILQDVKYFTAVFGNGEILIYDYL